MTSLGIDPNCLSHAAQRQIAEKLAQNSRYHAAGAAAGGCKPSKMKNIPTYRITDGGAKIRFASLKEAARYDELILMLKAGEIRNLRLQQEYTLQEAYTTSDGNRVKRMCYRADFCYEKLITSNELFGNTPVKFSFSKDGTTIYWKPNVEDVKGCRTDVYKLKKKMMLERYGIEIQEV